jgi:hypothetical protein
LPEPIDTEKTPSLFDRQYSVKKLGEKFSDFNMRDASRAGAPGVDAMKRQTVQNDFG